jgi:hypothetical protein
MLERHHGQDEARVPASAPFELQALTIKGLQGCGAGSPQAGGAVIQR